MTDDNCEVYAVIVEFKDQAPVLMECEGPNSSRDAAYDYMNRLKAMGHVIRACVVRLTYDGGNSLLIHDMKRMQP